MTELIETPVDPKPAKSKSTVHQILSAKIQPSLISRSKAPQGEKSVNGDSSATERRERASDSQR